MTLIKYGMSRNYLPDWTYQEALREIYQNFQDFGDYTEKIYERDNNEQEVVLKNSYTPDSSSFLAIGNSGKRDDPNTIGQHGEGMKMAFLVLLREGQNITLEFDGKIYTPIFYSDDYLGECFGITVEEAALKDELFSLTFDIPKEEYGFFNKRKLNNDDVIFTCHYGEIINRPAGEVYVGGQYVSKMEGLKYSYNFPPSTIGLDRDRKLPNTFDVHYNASQILSRWQKLKISDLDAQEAQYVDVPDRIAKRFKPSIKNNQVVFADNKGNIANSQLANKLLKNKKIQQKVVKLKTQQPVSKPKRGRRKKPSTLLKEFFTKYHYHFHTQAEIEYKQMIQKVENFEKKQ